MALLEWASSLTPQQWAFTAVGAIALLHIVPYLWDANRMRKYPGPFLAKFSYLWLGYHSMMGHRSEVVHEMHRQYGVFGSDSLIPLGRRDVTHHIPLMNRFLGSPGSQLSVYCRPGRAADRIRAWKWHFEIRLLRCIRLHSPRCLQLPRQGRTHEEEEDHLAHLLCEERRRVRT